MGVGRNYNPFTEITQKKSLKILLIIQQAGGWLVPGFACFLKFATIDSPRLPGRIEASVRFRYSQVSDNNFDQAKDARGQRGDVKYGK
jgi:hypothetical protein